MVTTPSIVVAKRCQSNSRRGLALLLTIFVIAIVSGALLNIVNTSTRKLAAVRQFEAYERALQLASAGVHHAAATLTTNNSFRGVITEGAFPASGTYTATVADGSLGLIVVTSQGSSNGVIRKVVANLQL